MLENATTAARLMRNGAVERRIIERDISEAPVTRAPPTLRRRARLRGRFSTSTDMGLPLRRREVVRRAGRDGWKGLQRRLELLDHLANRSANPAIVDDEFAFLFGIADQVEKEWHFEM